MACCADRQNVFLEFWTRTGATFPVESPCLKVVYAQLSATGFLQLSTRRMPVGSLAGSVISHNQVWRLGHMKVPSTLRTEQHRGPVGNRTECCAGPQDVSKIFKRVRAP